MTSYAEEYFFDYNTTFVYAVPVDELMGSVTGVAVAEGVDEAPPLEEGFCTVA